MSERPWLKQAYNAISEAENEEEYQAERMAERDAEHGRDRDEWRHEAAAQQRIK